MRDAAREMAAEAIDRNGWGTFRTARRGVRSLWLASSKGSDRGCGSEGGRPDAPDCTTPPFSPRPFPTHGPFRVQTLTNLTLIAQTSHARDSFHHSPASTLRQSRGRRHCSPSGGTAHIASPPVCRVTMEGGVVLGHACAFWLSTRTKQSSEHEQQLCSRSEHGGQTVRGWWKEEEGKS